VLQGGHRGARPAGSAGRRAFRSPFEIDIYAWLTWPFFRLRQPIMTAWSSLVLQFGCATSTRDTSRSAFPEHYRTRRPSEPLPEDFETESPEQVRRAEQELASCLQPLLATLPPEYRQALVLSELEGLPQREIARREGLSVSGAKSRVQRARRMLREAVLACCRVEVDRRGGITDFEARGGCDPCEGSATPCGSGRSRSSAVDP